MQRKCHPGAGGLVRPTSPILKEEKSQPPCRQYVVHGSPRQVPEVYDAHVLYGQYRVAHRAADGSHPAIRTLTSMNSSRHLQKPSQNRARRRSLLANRSNTVPAT